MRKTFSERHTLYALNFSLDICDGPHLNLQQLGKIRNGVKFAELLKEITSVFEYAGFENIIEISKTRRCYVTFLNE